MPGVTRTLHPFDQRSVQVAVVGRVLEEGALVDQLLEALTAHERVVDAVDLFWARPTRGAGDRVAKVSIELEQALDQRVLADAGRAGEDDQEPALLCRWAQSWNPPPGPGRFAAWADLPGERGGDGPIPPGPGRFAAWADLPGERGGDGSIPPGERGGEEPTAPGKRGGDGPTAPGERGGEEPTSAASGEVRLAQKC